MRNLTGHLFGGVCFLCRGAASDALCSACDADLPRLSEPRCPCCALESPRGEICGRCLAERPHYDGTRAALAYQFPGDALVQALKFKGELALAGLLGRCGLFHGRGLYTGRPPPGRSAPGAIT